jgi:hypothetical protein
MTETLVIAQKLLRKAMDNAGFIHIGFMVLESDFTLFFSEIGEIKTDGFFAIEFSNTIDSNDEFTNFAFTHLRLIQRLLGADDVLGRKQLQIRFFLNETALGNDETIHLHHPQK